MFHDWFACLYISLIFYYCACGNGLTFGPTLPGDGDERACYYCSVCFLCLYMGFCCYLGENIGHPYFFMSRGVCIRGSEFKPGRIERGVIAG